MILLPLIFKDLVKLTNYIGCIKIFKVFNSSDFIYNVDDSGYYIIARGFTTMNFGEGANCFNMLDIVMVKSASYSTDMAGLLLTVIILNTKGFHFSSQVFIVSLKMAELRTLIKIGVMYYMLLLYN